MPATGITVLKHNVPWGPFTRAQIEEGIARGDFTVKYLAHAPGLSEWLPLGEVLDYVSRHESPAVPTLPPVPEPRELPPVPAAKFPPADPPVIAPAAAPIRPPVLPLQPIGSPDAPLRPVDVPVKPPVTTKADPAVVLEPASFFLRGIAFLVDCGILFVPVAILFILGLISIELPAWWNHTNHQIISDERNLLRLNMWRLSGIMAIGCGWLYGAGLESSRSQATIGKRWTGLKVTDSEGGRMTFLRATGRYAAKYLSALPCFLGFIMALFSSRGLALHDRLSGTRVVRS